MTTTACARFAAMIAAGTLMAACGRASGPAPPAAEDSASVPAAAPTSTEVRPRIISITPDTIEVRDGHAERGSYELEYEVTNYDRVTKAELVVYARGWGNVQKPLEVTVQAKGTFRFFIDGATADFGPTVRFKATCPAGETDWYTLGSEPLPFDVKMSTALRIGAVSPDSIAQGMTGPESPGVGVPVTVWGQALTRDCSAQAEVNGRAVELMNVNGQPKMLRGLLMRRDLDYRAVSTRFLEVKLQLTGRGFRNEAIAHVRFAE